MQNASFVKTSEVLDQLDEWLTSLGIEPKRDRWHQAAEMVKRGLRECVPRRHRRITLARFYHACMNSEAVRAAYALWT